MSTTFFYKIQKNIYFLFLFVFDVNDWKGGRRSYFVICYGRYFKIIQSIVYSYNFFLGNFLIENIFLCIKQLQKDIFPILNRLNV